MKTRCVTISLKQDITPLIEQYPKWAWILHDKDSSKETGELIEPHYHYYLEFLNQRHLDSIAKEFNIEINMIEVVRDKKGILSYLTHSRHPDKYQYDISEVHANFEIKRATEDFNMITIYKLLKECKTKQEFISELVHRGLTGNPLHNLVYINTLWKDKYESTNKKEKQDNQYYNN